MKISEKNLMQAILDTPTEDGLLTLLEKKDKELVQHGHTFDSELRKGFLLAQDIVKKWANKHYPLLTKNP